MIEEDKEQIEAAREDYEEERFESVRDLLRHRKKRSEPKVSYERLGGNRKGRNICVSGRITDDMDRKIDILAEKENSTRSKIISEALEKHIKEESHKDTTKVLYRDTTTWAASSSSNENTVTSTNEGYIDTTSMTILIEKDEDNRYIGIVPSLGGCYAHGVTLDELFVNLREVIEGNAL